jgi:hypothetical protein
MFHSLPRLLTSLACLLALAGMAATGGALSDPTPLNFNHSQKDHRDLNPKPGETENCSRGECQRTPNRLWASR